MTVKQISDLIFYKQSVNVFSASEHKSLYKGVNEHLPEALKGLNVNHIGSGLYSDFDSATDAYIVSITIFVD